MGVETIVPLGFFTMVLGIVVGLPLVRAYSKRMERGPVRDQLPSGEVISRLDRIEQAIEAMATEVERIAEGQRFTTKLLSEVRTAPALSAPAPQPAPQAPRVPDGTVLSEAARRT
jgi:hypothetical protein